MRKYVRKIFQNFTRCKSVALLLQDLQDPNTQLKKVLGPWQLMALGIGAVIGAGIFASIGTAAAGDSLRLGAGPAVTLSFVLTAVACGFAALCYAEFAAMVPISGSAYTYSYATLGELIAWIIGWDLIIEYAVGNVAVAISWSGYFTQLLAGVGVHLPAWLTTDLRTALATPEILAAAPHLGNIPIVCNLPAAAIVLLITALLVVGIKESARFNSLMVIVKLLTLALFVFVGIKYVQPANWHPFMPNGWVGVQAGAAVVFFAYIGFDAVSTTAEECRNPARDMPIGIIGSLLICTLIYVVVAVVLTSLVPYQSLGVAEPLTLALTMIGQPQYAGFVSFGAVVALTAVLLVFQLGQPRIFFSMARDGLLPPWCAKVHPKYRTPHVTTIITGIGVALFAAFANINEVVDLTNIGTLFAFILVCLGIIVLRVREPNRERPFKAPFFPVVPILGILSCLYLMMGLPQITWVRFGLWLAAGLVLYFAYSRNHSKLNGNF